MHELFLNNLSRTPRSLRHCFIAASRAVAEKTPLVEDMNLAIFFGMKGRNLVVFFGINAFSAIERYSCKHSSTVKPKRPRRIAIILR